MEGSQRRFLAPVLARGGAEDAAYFSHERPAGPQRACLVEEVAHLRRHVAEAGRGAEEDRIVVLQLRWIRDGGGLVETKARRSADFDRHQLGYSFDLDRGAC